MLWLAAAVLLIPLTAARLLFGLRNAQLNFPGGFISSVSGSGNRLQPASPDRYERLLARYVKGDLFDSLWVAHREATDSGIVMSHERPQTEISVGFSPVI